MKNAVFIFCLAVYYWGIALFGPNPVPGEPNQFSVIMLFVSLITSSISVGVYIWSVLPAEEVVEEYEQEMAPAPSVVPAGEGVLA